MIKMVLQDEHSFDQIFVPTGFSSWIAGGRRRYEGLLALDPPAAIGKSFFLAAPEAQSFAFRHAQSRFTATRG